ncbi:MAG: hypothetical protein WCU88_06250 [Elusimicrobiota bacterium]|jgi:hypothetical protein
MRMKAGVLGVLAVAFVFGAARAQEAQTPPVQAESNSPQAAQSAPQEQPKKGLETVAGFGIIPVTNWKSGQFVSYKDYLDIDFDGTTFATYEGGIVHRRTGLKAGLGGDVDNNVIGKVHRIMGYLGYEKFMLRVQGGNLRGNVHWTGPAVAGQPADADFAGKFTNVDLLYWKRTDAIGGLYFGIGYNAYNIPVQLNTEVLNTRGEIVYGNAAYQADMAFKSYTAMFGFDTMQSALSSGQQGLGFWAYSQDKIGFGSMNVNQESVRRVEAANPTRHVVRSGNLFTAMVDYDATFGMMWHKKAESYRLGLGLGYNISGQVVFPFGGGDLKTTADVRIAPFPYLLRHGALMKAVVAF